MFIIADTKTAKTHKDVYQNHFSKARVDKLQPLLQAKLDQFLSRLEQIGNSEGTVEIDTGYSALTDDTVMHWSYQESFGLLKSPSFKAPLLKHIDDLTATNAPLWYWPNTGLTLIRLIARLPDSWKPSAVCAVDGIVETCRRRILQLRERNKEEVKDSVFATALHETSPTHSLLSDAALTGDAVLMLLAGTVTTAEAMTFGTWHILNDSAIKSKLLLELDAAMPDPCKFYKPSDLEHVPYLRGVVKESIRLSLGASARLMRITPPEGATFCGEHIPGGTRVSFSNYIYYYDPETFPGPHEFKPERWIATDAKDQARVNNLEARMISFSRGSRSCIGINVAYAELYNTFAHVFRRFELSVEGTTEWDMEWKDRFVPHRNGHLNVRVSRRG